MHQPWKTDKWFISPWNYLPEITKNYAFQPKTQDSRRNAARRRAADGRRVPPGGEGRHRQETRCAGRPPDRGRHARGFRAGQGRDLRISPALGLKAEVFGFARCIPAEINVVKACGCQGVVVEIPGERSHDQVRLRLVGRSRDESVDRYDARGQGSRPVHGLLHHRRHPNRAEPLSRHRRAGGNRGTHGRAHHRRHDGRRHAGRGRPRREKSDRAAQETRGDSLSSGFRPRRGQHPGRPGSGIFGGSHHGHGPRRTGRQRAHGRRGDVAALPVRHRPRHPHRASSATCRVS